MTITVLNQQHQVVSIIPACIPHESAIKAAENLIREAALNGENYSAVNDNGESIVSPDFETFLQFVPHARRIASSLMDKMAQDPAALHMLLSGSPQIADLISASIINYFEKQIAIGREYLAMPEHKRQKVREQIFSVMFTREA
ncbi:hypothetical protein FMK81_13165 [Klebsiella oxytoca]|uniref:hypothetical protein n=1 Tax=Klebsiella oxytoca TaxID=571 RepID=UPI001CC9498D|nr:hypothetical protein [Klebsiella oxytoca]MBZ7262457.1 hypothetical protein [Klebsiella oxytoca]